MAATAASAGHLHLPPPEEPIVASRRCRALPTMLLRLPPAAIVPIAVNEEEDDAVVVLIDTHHRRAFRRAIRAIHHDEDDAHIPDLLRAQAVVHHSGHTKRVFLARHQQHHLYPTLIHAHFKSEPHHLLIWIFMAHSTDLDPRMDQRQGNTDRFLLRPHLTVHFSQMHCIIFTASTSAAVVQHDPFIPHLRRRPLQQGPPHLTATIHVTPGNPRSSRGLATHLPQMASSTRRRADSPSKPASNDPTRSACITQHDLTCTHHPQASTKNTWAAR